MNNQNSTHDHVPSSPQQHVGRVMVVKATHEFQPVNMDELHIKPGDEIVITNPEEGGWWEGTLGSKTGWFPSNYVVPIEDFTRGDKVNEMNCSDEYKGLIVNELLESEKRLIVEMEEFYERVIKNIGGLIGLKCHSDPVVGLLQGSYSGLISAHKTHILGPLQASVRVGKVFMDAASEVSAAHTSYCNNHPKFVQLIERNQEKLSGAFGDQSGVLRIITCLSAPFRRIEKYGNTLSELERYVGVGDVDRGSLQRSLIFFRNLEKSLTSLRKQKEMELEVLTPGAIKDFEGPDVSLLGEIILMNLLFVGRDKQPRYFVLFSNTILILAYDNLSNTLTYKGRIYVSGVTVSCCDGDESVTNGFEISGPTLHPILVSCPTAAIRNTWLTNLNELLRATRCYSTGTHSNNQQHSQQQTQSLGSNGSVVENQVIGSLSPPVQAWNITRLRPSAPYNPFLAEYKGGKGGTARSSSSSSGFENRGGGGSFKFKSGSFSGGIGGSGGISGGVSNEEDLCVLGIVDGFCGQKVSGGRSLKPGVASSLNPVFGKNRGSVAMQRSLSSEGHIGGHGGVKEVTKKKKYSWCCTGIDQYDANNRSSATPIVTRNLINKNLASPNRYHSNVLGNELQNQRVGTQVQKSLPQLVCNLREDVNQLNEKITVLARQLEDDRSFRGQLIELVNRLGKGNS